MELKENTVSDCFRLGKEQAYKSRSLVFYIPSACHHRPIFLSLRKLKSSSMYIRDKTIYADYQIKRKNLKYKYDLNFFMQKEKSEFKTKAGSLVFGSHAIGCI